MFRKFPTRQLLFSKRKRNPQPTLKAAVRIKTASINSLSRAERCKIRYDRKILVFENQRWRITEILQRQEEKLMQNTQPIQALEKVEKLMQVAINKVNGLKSIVEEENGLLTELNSSIEKLEGEINILEKIKFPSLRLKKKSSETLTEMRSLMSRTEEIIERIKVTADENDELEEKYRSIATKAKDILETYY